MSITKETTIWCDAPECGNHYQDWKDASGVRRELRDRGWVHRDGKDYCSEHARAVLPANSKGETP